MIKDWINVTRVKINGADRLYPKELEWKLAPGINAIIGGTGLGKTTLVYAVQFAVFGKLVIDSAERIEREFFKRRLTKRSGKDLDENPPSALVEFTVSSARFTVKRNLPTGAILEATVDGESVTAKKYENLLAEKIGIKDDFSSLTRLQSHVFFFGENRYLLAWENRLQHELINLMLADHATYRQLDEFWARAGSADSEARNISTQAARMEEDLEALSQTQSKVQILQARGASSMLTANRTKWGQSVNVIRKRIAKDQQIAAELESEIFKSQKDFHEDLVALEEKESSDLDDQLLAAALANPTIASVRHALTKFYQLPQERSCPCCGRNGIDATVSRLAATAATNASAGNCIVCSKSLPQPKGRVKPATLAIKEKTSKQATSLQTLLFKREQTRSRLTESHIEIAHALQQLADATTNELKHVKENPAGAGSHLQELITQLRGRESAARGESDRFLTLLKNHLAKTNAVFEKIQTKIVRAFKKYASLYLDEPCDVIFLQESELPGKRGPQIKAPHAAFFPVVSGETRPSAQELSDAQRSFVDLAFRMALIDVWHQETGGTVTMVIETPEGAVDIAYMERVAKMIRTFGDQGHTLIITTNLNNDIFLPEVMARWPKQKRAEHILNLLALGKPRPVQIANKSHFDAIIAKVSSQPHAQAK